VIAAFRELYSKDEEFSLLDAGCGFGHASCGIAEAFPCSQVHAIDLEPTVINTAEQLAIARGLATRIRFGASRLSIGRSAARFDALLFLAAQLVFGGPRKIQQWLQAFGKAGSVCVLDRASVVFPGLEDAEVEAFAEFQALLGHEVQVVGEHVITLGDEAGLYCVNLVLANIRGEPRKVTLLEARERLQAGEPAYATSKLYVVRRD
jgi:SAM-dependent methyltransferase